MLLPRDNSLSISRRSVLRGAAALAARMALPTVLPSAVLAADEATDIYGGLKMGLQSYTLRDRSLDKMFQAMQQDLKLHYVELYPGHVLGLNMDHVLEKAKSVDTTVLSYGVVGFSQDEKAARALFDRAKELKLAMLSCDPDPNSFDLLDKLTEEYGINLGIHDHGPDHRWGKIDVLDAAIKDHSKRIGLTCDTGHYIRAGEDPLRAMEVFKDRLYAVHVKDFKKLDKGWEDVPAGDATLDVPGMVKFLLNNKFDGGMFIEFEGQKKEDPTYPVTAAQTSAGRIADAVKKLR